MRKQPSCVSPIFSFCCTIFIIIHKKKPMILVSTVLVQNCSSRFWGLRWTETWEPVQTCDVQGKHRKRSGEGSEGRGGNYNQANSTLILPCILSVKTRVVPDETFQAAKKLSQNSQSDHDRNCYRRSDRFDTSDSTQSGAQILCERSSDLRSLIKCFIIFVMIRVTDLDIMFIQRSYCSCLLNCLQVTVVVYFM